MNRVSNCNKIFDSNSSFAFMNEVFDEVSLIINDWLNFTLICFVNLSNNMIFENDLVFFDSVIIFRLNEVKWLRKWKLFECSIDRLILSKMKILDVVNLSLFFNVRTWIQSRQWFWLKKRIHFFHIDFHEIIIIRRWFVFCRFHVSIDFMRDSISKRIS